MVENFGEYLRTLRLEKRYSLRQVEELSGVSNSYLGLIERGQRPIPGADILKKLAPVFDVPVRDLLAAAGYLKEEDIRVYTGNPGQVPEIWIGRQCRRVCGSDV